MRKSVICGMCCLVAGLFVAAPGFAANGLAVTAAAALEGNFGLAISQDGSSSNQVWVQDTSPNNETCAVIRFRIDPNGFNLPNGKETSVAVGQGPNINNTGANVFRINLVRSTTGSYRMRAHARLDDGPGIPNWARTASVTIGDAPRQIQVDWCAANGTGFIRVTRLDNNSMVEETNLTNQTRDWRRTKFGLPTLVRPEATGTFYLDDFEAYRE